MIGEKNEMSPLEIIFNDGHTMVVRKKDDVKSIELKRTRKMKKKNNLIQ